MQYRLKTLEGIANSIGVHVNRVLKCASKVEAAAVEYRVDLERPTFDRGRGLKLKPSEIQKKLCKIEATARKLLKHLGIEDVEAPDDLDLAISRWLAPSAGPTQNIDLLANWFRGNQDDGEAGVLGAAERLSSIVILIEGAKAAAFIRRQASEGQKDVALVRQIVAQRGPQPDPAFERWAARMVALYAEITGAEPAMSVGGPGRPNEGVAGGPLVRFLIACGTPLGITLGEDAWRSWFRQNEAMKKDRPDQNRN